MYNTAVVGHVGTVYVICNIEMLAKTESKPYRKKKKKKKKFRHNYDIVQVSE